MAEKFECPSCGYVYTAPNMPFDFRCPVCHTDGAIFKEMDSDQQNVQNRIEITESSSTFYSKATTKKAMTLAECKEYIGKIKTLEMTCYQLEKLQYALAQKVREAEITSQKLSSIKPEKRPEKSGFLFNFLSSLFCAILAALFGGVSGLVIGFIRWACSGDGFLENFSAGVDAPLKPYLTSTALFLAGLLGIATFALFYYVGVSADKNLPKSVAQYEQKEAERIEKIHRSQSHVLDIRAKLQKCETEYRQTKELLNKYYSLNFIYPKYRGIVPICMIYEYLESGRCFSLLGHEGAYNLYENELRMNLIIEKLDDIIYRLDDISANQRVLANEIKRSNAKIDNICRSLNNIEQNTALTQYYSSISATNTSYLAWLAYLDQKSVL